MTTDADADSFRAAMAHMPAPVAVVAARAAHSGPTGCTVSSVLSLSVRPPSLLVSLATSGRTLRAARSAGAFAVNLLSWEQRHLVRRFAEQPPGSRFDGVPWVPEGGQPVLLGAAVSIVCAVEGCYDVWDHTLVMGRVLYSAYHADRTPLLYHRRGCAPASQWRASEPSPGGLLAPVGDTGTSPRAAPARGAEPSQTEGRGGQLRPAQPRFDLGEGDFS